MNKTQPYTHAPYEIVVTCDQCSLVDKDLVFGLEDEYNYEDYLLESGWVLGECDYCPACCHELFIADVATKPYDTVDHLKTKEDMVAYLAAWVREHPEDADGFTEALALVTRANSSVSNTAKLAPGVCDWEGKTE